MATAVTTIWSLGVLRAFLKVTATSHDTQIETFANGVSQRIQSFLRRRVVTQSVTETLDGPAKCSNKLRLPDYPIVSITTVRVRANMLESWSTLDADQYELDSKHGVLYLLGSLNFYAGPRTIEVTYSAGFGAQDAATIPADIVSTGLDYVKFLYTRWANDQINATSMSQASRNASIPQELPKDMQDTLTHYMKRRI